MTTLCREWGLPQTPWLDKHSKHSSWILTDSLRRNISDCLNSEIGWQLSMGRNAGQGSGQRDRWTEIQLPKFRYNTSPRPALLKSLWLLPTLFSSPPITHPPTFKTRRISKKKSTHGTHTVFYDRCWTDKGQQKPTFPVRTTRFPPCRLRQTSIRTASNFPTLG